MIIGKPEVIIVAVILLSAFMVLVRVLFDLLP
jgi:hypothetical protein